MFEYALLYGNSKKNYSYFKNYIISTLSLSALKQGVIIVNDTKNITLYKKIKN